MLHWKETESYWKSTGHPDFILMAGPCSVESYDQIMRIAEDVKEAGAYYLRGGAFKPRTRGGDWEGLGEEGLKLLQQVKKEHGLKIVTEILGPERDLNMKQTIDMFLSYDVDVFQVGARNAQNQKLQTALGKANVPVLLKNGTGMTLDEWYGAATRPAQDRTMICVRGKNPKTETARFGQEMTLIAQVVNDGRYPVIFDPSHITGRRELVYDIAMGAVAMGVDGLQVEVHYDPNASFTDKRQAVTPEQFKYIAKEAKRQREIYLDRSASKKAFLHASIPQHVDIYFQAGDQERISQIFPSIKFKDYKPEKHSELKTGLIPASQVRKLADAGFAVGELFVYSEEEPYSTLGVKIDVPQGPRIHLSPYSEAGLAFTGRRRRGVSEGRVVVEYADAYPNDRIRDTFTTAEMKKIQGLSQPLVLYMDFKEEK